jgi:hypothetical protein
MVSHLKSAGFLSLERESALSGVFILFSNFILKQEAIADSRLSLDKSRPRGIFLQFFTQMTDVHP